MGKQEDYEISGSEPERIQNNTQQEILKQLKIQTIFARITAIAGCGVFLVLLISALVLVPRVNAAVTAANDTIVRANDAIDSVNELADTAGSTLDGIATASNNANDLIVENEENLTEAIEKINKVDFETLNESIQALHDTIAPFQKVVGVISALTGK